MSRGEGTERAMTADTEGRCSEPAATVTVYPDGPLVVRGDFVVRGIDGVPLDAGATVALCRCGRSATKPLCDGSHHNARRPVAGRDPS